MVALRRLRRSYISCKVMIFVLARILLNFFLPSDFLWIFFLFKPPVLIEFLRRIILSACLRPVWNRKIYFFVKFFIHFFIFWLEIIIKLKRKFKIIGDNFRYISFIFQDWDYWKKWLNPKYIYKQKLDLLQLEKYSLNNNKQQMQKTK